MTQRQLDIDHFRTWIGREELASDTITPELVKRFKATLSEHTEVTSQIPLGIHWCLAPSAVPHSGLATDGHPAKGGFLPPISLPHRMWASSKLRFLDNPTVGLPIERLSTVADVVLKNSAASGPLVFVHVDHIYTQKISQGSETWLTERQTIVYRESSAIKRAEPTETGTIAHSLNILPDSRFLFRYSALTFNAHRIHYDNHYATHTEGYPGLVVHGPLMATLLMNLAQAKQTKKALQSFEFRAAAPAFCDIPLQLVVENENTESLAVRNNEQALIMTANARFADHDAS